ncbi:MAG TPA: septum formation initiator family protein [Jatrophihabitans sp.]|jgi:cell division protein FtsB
MRANVLRNRSLTGRALVLAVLVVLLVVLLASPLHRYFGSRSDAAGAAQTLQQDKVKLAELQKQLQLWSDPGYVQEQARSQLQYAMPGDTVYVVVDKGAQSDIQKTEKVQAIDVTTGSWNERLWSSVQKAAS